MKSFNFLLCLAAILIACLAFLPTSANAQCELGQCTIVQPVKIAGRVAVAPIRAAVRVRPVRLAIRGTARLLCCRR